MWKAVNLILRQNNQSGFSSFIITITIDHEIYYLRITETSFNWREIVLRFYLMLSFLLIP
jgi:hypothetical protein